MRKKSVILLLIAILGGVYFFYGQKKETKQATLHKQKPGSFFQKNTPTPGPVTKSRAVFVPYWASMTKVDRDEYDRYLYFGVSVNEQGVVKDDVGYSTIGTFTAFAEGKDKWLTVRMLDHDTNTAILQNPSVWVGIAHDIASVARDNGFQGVVLDLEVGLASFHITPDSINGFTEALAHEVHGDGLQLAMTLYGDTYFRQRPYDVKYLGSVADEVILMAYDFHKSFGEAGPNFPLNGRETYGYDFSTMVDDFRADVPGDKLEIAYGMFGYEWEVDDQGRPYKAASALTLNQIRGRFLQKNVRRDSISAETEITFKDEAGRKHMVWFEDEESVRAKQGVAEKQGIGGSVFWAYGYL